MSQAKERVYVIGGTGNVGTKTVQDLIANHIPTTLYARNPSKVASLFPNGKDLIQVVQGDLSNLTPLEHSLAGHTRLFLLVSNQGQVAKIKTAIAKLAYAAGIKQIVDISSNSVCLPWRATGFTESHRCAEEAIFNLPERGAYVALRPDQFMSNIIHFDRPGETEIVDSEESDEPQCWISPNDIGALAAIILREDIEKHGDAAYQMIGDIVTPAQKAAILTRILDRPITYRKVSVVERYNQLKQATGGYFPHRLLYDLVSMSRTSQSISKGLPILLGREPETLEAYLASVKQSLL
ncbi:hypothetical protein EC973_000043 [Apophysomyces ossiformis]|uniref:NAD(P)-binding domain-containing protein n=1 Tax=Apophysomyces ossiformis TaxID=679940 RepID=A0A8H7BWH9_9FUNG|nr:hypothetical protein EC973_000043 [Apophysomyces ossiformis]